MNKNEIDKMFPPSFVISPTTQTPPRKKRTTPKKDLEGAVVRECRMFLTACEQVVYVERRNTGAVQFEDGGFIRFGSKGAADIWCLVRQQLSVADISADDEDDIFTFGEISTEDRDLLTHVEIEVKRRDGKGRLSPDQKLFEQFCEKAGIPYFVVTSAEDLASQLQKAGLLT